LLELYNFVYLWPIKTTANMKTTLLAFAATFIAMAAADQENYLAALIMIPVSVYLFLKSLKENGH